MSQQPRSGPPDHPHWGGGQVPPQALGPLGWGDAPNHAQPPFSGGSFGPQGVPLQHTPPAPPPPPQPTPQGSEPKGRQRGVLVGVAVALMAALLLGGIYVVYPLLRGSQGTHTGSLIADIVDRPSLAWSAHLNLPRGEIQWTQVVDIGENRAAVAASVDTDGDYYGDTVQLAVVRLSDGAIAWEVTVTDFYADYSAVLGDPDSGYVGLLGIAGDLQEQLYGDTYTYEVNLFAVADGAATSKTFETQVAHALVADDALYLAMRASWDLPTTSVLKFDARNLDTASWETTVRLPLESDGLCLVGETMVVGAVYELDDGCHSFAEIAAYDHVTGDLMGFSRATGDHVNASVTAQGILLAEWDPATERRGYMLVDEHGADVWERSIRATASSAAVQIGASQFYVVMDSNADAFDFGTGEAVWTSPVRDVGSLWGEVNGQVIARTEDRILWIDAATGEINHSLRFTSDSGHGWRVAASRNFLYFAHEYGQELVALTDDGQEAWSWQVGDTSGLVVVGEHLLVVDSETAEVSVLR